MPFVGTHDHTLDSKVRLVLPSKFRSHFTDGAYLSPWAGCVALWTTERFTEMVRRIAEEIRAGDTDSDVQRALGANSEMVRPDAQGRIMVPPRLRDFAALERDVVICGAISQYNNKEAVKGPANYLSLLVNRARMQGMVVMDYVSRYPEAMKDMAGWMQSGELKSKEDVVEGLETFPDTLMKLFTGGNFGKLVLKVS